MKLAFATLGCPDWTFDKVVEEAKKLGFAGVEIRGINNVMRAEEIEAFFPENVEKTKKTLADSGLALVGLNTSCKFDDDEKFEAAIDEGKKAIDVCVRMGIPSIRVFGDKIPDKSKHDHITSEVARGIKILCEYARGKNVSVMLEIHGDFNCIEAVKPVVNGVSDCPEFAIIWDLEHSDKAYENNWKVFYDEFKPYIRHIHVKDYYRGMQADGRYKLSLVGDGEIPLEDIINCLKADGFDGYYSLEWEKKWHPYLPDPEVAFPAYVEYMKRFG